MLYPNASGSPSIIVASSKLPFADGGAERLARTLNQKLIDNGFRSELWFVPQNPFGRQGAAYFATRLTVLQEDSAGKPIDAVISLRFPAYALVHTNQVVWLTHRMREYYDLWPQFFRQLPTPTARILAHLRRAAIRTADRWLLKRCTKHVFCISREEANRLRRWGHIDAEVLYPPPPERNYYTAESTSIFLAVSRLHSLKRLDLFIRAMAHLRHLGIPGIIVGQGDQLLPLTQLIKDLGLESSISIRTSVTDDEITHLYAQSIAVFFAPFQEDYGFVTLESFLSGRPVVTCTDSGGVLEFVIDGETGIVVEPDPETIAGALKFLAERHETARTMGMKGRERAQMIRWTHVIEKLTQHVREEK